MSAEPVATAPAKGPRHVALIMDGNGRWAQRRGLPRAVGHRRGMESVRTAVETSRELGVAYLTLFSFSSENWARPPLEIQFLFGLLRLFIQRDLAQPIWRIVFHAVWIYWRLVFRGTAYRFFAANWRFATFITWPHILLLAEAIFAGAIAFGVEWGLDALGVSNLFSMTAAAAVFVAVLGHLFEYYEKLPYFVFSVVDTVWS